MLLANHVTAYIGVLEFANDRDQSGRAMYHPGHKCRHTFGRPERILDEVLPVSVV